jgi:predicted ArsR family transcriptional regulator
MEQVRLFAYYLHRWTGRLCARLGPALRKEHRQILSVLKSGPQLAEELCESTGLKRWTLDSCLIELENRHLVKVTTIPLGEGRPHSLYQLSA